MEERRMAKIEETAKMRDRVHELGWARFLDGRTSESELLQAHTVIKRFTGQHMKNIKEKLWHPQGRLLAKYMAEVCGL